MNQQQKIMWIQKFLLESSDLDMKNFKIKNLASPTAAQDAVNKKYFDEELLNSHLTSSYIENAFKYLLDQDESSSERNIL